jgi:hypothetical protein
MRKYSDYQDKIVSPEHRQAQQASCLVPCVQWQAGTINMFKLIQHLSKLKTLYLFHLLILILRACVFKMPRLLKLKQALNGISKKLF